MKLLIHTDVVVDLAVNPDDSLLEQLSRDGIQAWLLAASLPDAVRQIQNTSDDPKTHDRLRKLVSRFPVVLQAGPEVADGLDDSRAAFSETLAAKAVRDNNLDAVLTLNADPFSNLGIVAITPAELKAQLAQPAAPVDKVALLDIPGSYHEWINDAERAIAEVIRSGRFILGPQVQDLENRIAEYCQTRFAVGVSSGTDALVIALMAADIGPGDEVITTPFTFFATVGSIVRVGAKPVFVDIDPETFNIDTNLIPAAVTSKTKAIIPVHLYGQCADMNPIEAIAKEHNLTVIEDAAQAIGSEYKERRAGSLGDLGCFSFFPTKNLGGFGDGGIVTTNSESLLERLRILRMHGSHPKYYHKFVGGNFRLDTLQAAVVLAKLPYLDGWTKQRQQNADRYRKLIADANLGAHIQTPEDRMSRHIYNQFVIRVADGKRDALREHIQARGIGCEVYYPLSLHEQECFRNLGYKTGDFKVSEKAATETLALPNSFEVKPQQQEYVVSVIQDFYS